MVAASSRCEIEDYKSWMFGLNASRPQLLHMMIRIRDVKAALRFYVDGLGMRLLGRFEVEARRVTAIFVGFEVGSTAVELAHYWDKKEPYSHGSSYSHLAVGVPELDVALARLVDVGAEVTIRPTILVAGMPRVAFVKDPDGYMVQLIQTRNG